MLSDENQNQPPDKTNDLVIAIPEEPRMNHQISRQFLVNQATIVRRELMDDFGKAEITYLLKQVFTGDQGLHLTERSATLKIVLSDDQRYVQINLKAKYAFCLPFTEIQKFQICAPALAGHSPLILLTVTDSIVRMIHEQQPNLLNNRNQSALNGEMASLFGNLLILLIKPFQTVPTESPIYCDVKIQTLDDVDRFILDMKGALDLIQIDVRQWLTDSTLDPYETEFSQMPCLQWWTIMKRLNLICIHQDGAWRLEPKRHVLRVENITASFMRNTREELIQLHPPWHPTPLVDKRDDSEESYPAASIPAMNLPVATVANKMEETTV